MYFQTQQVFPVFPMVSWSDLRSLTLAVGSFLPLVKVVAGVWFCKKSAELLWRVAQPILEFGRRAKPRFSAGRVDKFYKFTPPRVKRRRTNNRKEQSIRLFRQICMEDEVVMDVQSGKLLNGMEEEFDMNELIYKSFSFCTSACCMTFMPTSCPIDTNNGDLETDSRDVTSPPTTDVRLAAVKSDDEPAVDDNEPAVDDNENQTCIGKLTVDIEPSTTTEETTDIHKKVFKDFGLLCLPSEWSNDHNHATESPKDEQDNQVILLDESVLPHLHPDYHYLPPCLSSTKLKRIVSSTPCSSVLSKSPASCTSIPNRTATRLLNIFSMTAPLRVPPSELENEERQKLNNDIGENLASILEDTETSSNFDAILEETYELELGEAELLNEDNKQKSTEAIFNIYGMFSPDISAEVEETSVLDTYVDANECKVSTEFSASCATDIECFLNPTIKELFKPFCLNEEMPFHAISIDVDKTADIGDETESHNSIKVELESELSSRPKTTNDVIVTTASSNVEYSPSSSKIEVENVSSLKTVEGSSSSEEGENKDTNSINNSLEQNLYVHISY